MEKEHLLSILDGINESIYISDPLTHEMLYANEILVKSFGSFSQKKCYQYLQNNDSPCSFCSNKNIFGENLGREHTREFRNRRNNRWYSCMDKAIKWPDGRMVRCEIAVDIDDVKEKGFELERYNSHLNDLVIERTKRIHSLAELSMDFICESSVILRNIIKELSRMLDAQTVVLSEIKSGKAHVLHLYIDNRMIEDRREYEIEGTPCAGVCETKDIKVFNNVQELFPDALMLKECDASSYCGIPCLDSKGSMMAVLCIIDNKSKHFSEEDRDITRIIGQRIGRELERNKSEEILTVLYKAMETINVGITIADREGTILYTNPAEADMHGFSVEELIGKKTYIYAPSNLKRGLDLSKRQWKGTSKRESQNIRKDGSSFPVFLTSDIVKEPSGEPLAVITVSEDITERKYKEIELEKSENNYRSIFENASIGMISIDINGKLSQSNGAFSEMLGYSNGELNGKSLLDIFLPEDAQLVKECYKKFVAGETENMQVEKKLVANGGRIIWANVHISALKEIDGNVFRFIGQVQNITDRKLAEKKLRKSEERYALIIEGASDGIWDRDLLTGDVYFSPRWKQMLGYKDDEFRNNIKNLYSIIHPSDIDMVSNEIKKHLNGNTSHYISEFRIRHKDGSYRWVLARGATKRDDSGKPVRFAGSHTDITERKLMEEELLKGQRLESIGILAGGIAHDFNNILTGVITNLEVAKDCLLEQENEDEDIIKSLNYAESAAMRAADLTRQLLTFSKGGAPVMKTVSIGELLVETATFVLRGSNVRRRCHISDDLCNVKIDENQISQVINNLVINAKQAMPDGGTVTIRAENVYIDKGSLPSLNVGKYIKITIKDRGCGISEGNLIKIFDPYFTTKSKGSGLGLATSYTIIKRHSGHIIVESDEGLGTQFQVYLPASEEVKAKKEEKVVIDYSGFVRVLLLEDEDIVATSVNMIASSVGYELEHARDGKEAVKFYKNAMKKGRSFDVVMMDLTIVGGMGGVETIKRLKKIDPFIKAIVCSGYSDDAVMANYGEYGFCDVLPKPFTKDQVLEKWANVIKGNT